MPRHLDEVLTQTKRFYTAKTHPGHWGEASQCGVASTQP